MGFAISQSTTYTWPVEIKLPADGGQYTKHTFDAEFARTPQSEIEKIISGLTQSDLTDADVCTKILKGWKGITGDDGADLPFSPTTLAQVLDIPTVAMSIIKAWMESLTGARSKN